MAFPMNIFDLNENLSKVETPCNLNGCLFSRLGILAHAMLMRPNKAKAAVPGGTLPGLYGFAHACGADHTTWLV